MSRPTTTLGRLTEVRSRGGLGLVDVSLLGLTVVTFTAAAVSFGSGVYCYTQPDPGIECAALIAILPLVLVPLGAISAIFGAAHAGWLVRANDDAAGEESAASDDD